MTINLSLHLYDSSDDPALHGFDSFVQRHNIHTDTVEEMEVVQRIFLYAMQTKLDMHDMIKDGVCLYCNADWTKPEEEREFK